MYNHPHHQKSKIAIVAIAASAGGITGIRKLLSQLPSNFPVPILCLQHLHPSDGSVLAQVLQLRTNLTVRWASHGEQLMAGVVYVCPPSHYFLVHANGTISLAPQATKHGWLDGVNHFFQSVAESYAESAAVIVLSGTGSGGAEGIKAVHKYDGIVLVQDQSTAIADGMPKAAIATGCVDRILPREEMATCLMSLVYEDHSFLSREQRNVTSSVTTKLPISPILQDKLEDLLDRAIAMHRTDMGHIQLFNHHTNSLFISTQRGFTSDCLNYLRTVSINNTANSKPLIVEDVATDPLHLTHLDIAKVAGYRAFQSTPLIGRRGKLVGVLSTHFRQPRKFLPWEINLINLHAGHIADLIEVFQT